MVLKESSVDPLFRSHQVDSLCPFTLDCLVKRVEHSVLTEAINYLINPASSKLRCQCLALALSFAQSAPISLRSPSLVKPPASPTFLSNGPIAAPRLQE